MKAQCRANVETAIGRPLEAGEEQFIEKQLISQLRQAASANPTKFKAMSHAQRIRMAGNQAATALARDQAVTEWNDAAQDELYTAIKEEFIKAGAKLNPELMEDLEGDAVAVYLDDVVAFSLAHVQGKTVANAVKGLQGVISHELLHWARAVNAFTPQQWDNLTTGAENLIFRKSDAKLVGEEKAYEELIESGVTKPTYRDYADHFYSGRDDSVRAEEAVAKAIEVEAARWAAKEEAQQGGVFRKAIGALIKMGRTVLDAINRLASPKQAMIREYFSQGERALRRGQVNRQRYGDMVERTRPVKIEKIAESVTENIPQAEIDDLIQRLENPMATAAEIADAPVWDTLEQLQNGPTATLDQINDPKFWTNREYEVDGKKVHSARMIDHAVKMFAARAGKKLIKGARATILTGAPGAGKTTIADKIAKSTGSAVVEADSLKPFIPGYNGGINQLDVHPESQALSGQAMRQLMAHKANMVLERIGNTPDGMMNLINILKKNGYVIDVVHVRSDFSNRMRGAAVRFLQTGRWIPPSDQIEIGNRPTSVHQTVIRNNLAASTYEVRLNKKGTYDVLGGSGRHTSKLNRAITSAAGGGLGRLGQQISGVRSADPRTFALEQARAFREWNGRVGPTLGRPAANFGGKHAVGADKTALQLAIKMNKDGVDKNTIRHTTGWFQPLNGGKWRYTLPSGKITLKREFAKDYIDAWEKKVAHQATLEDYIDTPIFDAYPSLRKLRVVVNPAAINGAETSSILTHSELGIGRALRTSTHEQMFAHEIQHLISAIEGFEKGGSPHYIAQLIRRGKNMPEAPVWAEELASESAQGDLGYVMQKSMALYYALTDEVQARDAELLEAMSPEERAAFDPTVTFADTLGREQVYDSPLDMLKSMPLKWWAGAVAGGIAGGWGSDLLSYIAQYITANASSPEDLYKLPDILAAGRPEGIQQTEAPQELGLTRNQAQRFADMADRYPPFVKAIEAAGLERLPKRISRDQFTRLRRAMQNITDLDFIPEMTPLQRKYSTAPTQAARKFQSYAKAEKDFLAFLENGMMDGGFRAMEARKRETLHSMGGKIIVNPSAADLYAMTRVPKGAEAYKHDTIRYIKDREGNVFVTNGANMIHDQMARYIRELGFKLEGYKPGFQYNDDDHGLIAGSLRRTGNTFTSQDADSPGNINDIFPNFRPMEARKPKPMRVYNAKGGRKGAMKSSTTYGSIPPQPGFLDDVAYVTQQIGAVPTRKVAGVTIQDKRMQVLRPWNVALGKLDEIDKVAEQLLKKGWMTALRSVPFIDKMVQSYFPFGGVPDRVALELLRSLAQGRTGAAQDIARDVAGAISKALKISPADALRALAGDYSKQQQVADRMEALRDAMTDPDPTTQATKVAAIKDAELRQAVIRARNVIDDIGEALVEHGILHENQRAKYAGHYLRRAYMEHFENYRPSGGVRASGAHYRKYREGLPEDRRLSKGEIKDLPFLVYLSIEEPLRDLGLYSYLNSLVHYSASAPSNPGWVLPDSIVMFGGKYRTLFYIAKEKERNDASLEQKRNQLSDLGGPKAVGVAAARLVREIRILEQISKVMEGYVKANPQYARALQKGELPKGYKQLPDDTARFGDMAGAIVMRQLYDDIMGGNKSFTVDDESAGERAKQFYNDINRNAKFLLTVANPPTHLRNLYSNTISLARSGTNPLRLIQAVYELQSHLRGKNSSPAVKAALKFGAMKQSFTEQELRLMDEFARNLQLQEKRAESRRKKEARKLAMGPASKLLNAPLTAMDVATMMAGAAKNGYATGASWMYQMEDVVFKIAKIADEMDRGTPPAVAALEARKHFFDYSAVSDPVRWLRNSAIAPFISYIYFAIPNFIEQVATAPWRLGMTTYLPALGLLALFSMMWGYEPEEAKQALSEVLAARPMLLPVPWRDEHDRIQWIDLGYMLPEGALIGLMSSAFNGDLKSAISAIGFSGGPVLTAAIGLTTGVDPFRGMPIWEETDSPEVQSAKGFAFAMRSFMPSMLSYNLPPFPGEDVGGPGYEAMFGTGEDRYGQPTQTESQLASRMLGINIYPSDVNYGIQKRIRQYRWQMRELRSQLDRTYVDNRLTPEMRQERVDRLTRQFNRVQTDYMDYVNSTANAAEAESRRRRDQE